MNSQAKVSNKKLNAKERYRILTRDLDWEFSYADRKDAFPYEEFEGIKITDWSKWEDPFRLTMDAYWKYQAEKEKKLYAIFDAFAQNNGQMNVSNERYVNAIKLFLTAVTPLEYQAYQGYAHVGRQFGGIGARIASQMQSIDELRHVQTQIHAMSHYNKFFDGFQDWAHMHDRVWYLSVPKSFFEDARSAGPFEFLLAISFAFEYVLTNLLFVPFMSGAAYNGDMATVTFGFSAQSDEARHMTLGLEIVKFLLEQHEDNVPIVQEWIDKWFWRGTRLLSIVGMMMDYMLPNKVMSWKEAWETYFEEAGGALFKDLSRYGIRMPKYSEVITKEKEHVSHQAWWIFYNFGHAAGFHTWIPTDEEMDWLSAKYPDTFDQYYRPRWELARKMEAEGKRFYSAGLPQLCQVCQIPMTFTEMDGDQTMFSYRESIYQDERYHTCSNGCHDIFEREPEKYIQAWLPVHQILQGNCGGPDLESILRDYYNFNVGADNLDIEGSPDQKRWKKWKGDAA
ncbi:aromatic/alkene/methane monooxygenase hydroxylase/oxygenase subunit alpha [Acinetobacter sp.]|jgi:phenol hydroxylase P3 protein|uniref:aromatic/alkene/methane monooxygenase hydroxylase/oxygenase subunit alpha n=1 Tax=Acinetobacter sp. TaxID=472 RepID=UPI0028216549|nr:aromatic/alkene/methane monooxygenase hydroxylase/oxygenase subunit alpha [Acinetobacter sp.]MDR0235351.1 aromatic/alkene/methane monooxygenase hydroxylase/oxygenase subunit alpha [Acinetobacter sp.]